MCQFIHGTYAHILHTSYGCSIRHSSYMLVTSPCALVILLDLGQNGLFKVNIEQIR
jgi:hypothetical protein